MSSSIKDRFEAYKSKVRGHASNNAGSYKDSATAGGVGVGAYFLGDVLSKKIEFLRDKWYGAPLILAMGGHFLKKKNAAAGFGLLGAAGYMGALNYKMTHQAATQTQGLDNAGDFAQGVFDVVESRGLQDAGGLDDAGAIQEVMGLLADDATGLEDAGALQDASGDGPDESGAFFA